MKKKCSFCGEKIERKFSFCPYCGGSFKKKSEKENFGMLGRDDFVDEREIANEIKLPFGLNKIMNGLMKQMDKQLEEMMRNSNGKAPKGFKIQISRGNPQIKRVQQPQKKETPQTIISPEEANRRAKLPRVDADSKVKRLSDRIVYEIPAPGVKSKKDIVVTKLEDGVEIKAYSKDKCFVKVIPLKIEIYGCYVEDGKVFVEMKS